MSGSAGLPLAGGDSPAPLSPPSEKPSLGPSDSYPPLRPFFQVPPVSTEPPSAPITSIFHHGGGGSGSPSSSPFIYTPSPELEQHRTLADVGACVQSCIGGALYCKRVFLRVRHPDFPQDCLPTQQLVVRLSARSQQRGSVPSSYTSERGCSESNGITLFNSQGEPPRLLVGSATSKGQESFVRRNLSLEVLRIEVYDDVEAFMLLELEVDRSDFRRLRTEQRLLVDFDALPSMLIELFEGCGPYRVPERGAGASTDIKENSGGKAPDGEGEAAAPSEQRLYRRGSHASVARWSGLGQSDSSMMLTGLLVCEVASEPTSKNTENGANSRPRDQSLSQNGETASMHLNPDPPAASQGLRDQPRHRNWSLELPHLQTSRRVVAATLSFIELSQFRELTHLSLRLQAADHSALRAHLAHRLSQYRIYASTLEREFKTVDKCRLHWYNTCASVRQQQQALFLDLERLKQEMTLKHAHELERVSEEKERAVEEQRKWFQREREKLDAELKQAVLARDALQGEVSSLQSKQSELTGSMISLKDELAAAQETVRKQGEELARSHAARAELQEKFDRVTAELGQLRERLAAEKPALHEATLKLCAAEELGRELKNQIDAFAETRASWRERERGLRGALELSAKEIAKGNETIQKLQAALRKERQKLKQSKEEQQAGAVDLEEARKSFSNLEIKTASLRAERDALEAEVLELRDLKRQYEAQQQTIKSLEKQLTDRTVENVILSSSVSKGGSASPLGMHYSTTTAAASASILLARSQSAMPTTTTAPVPTKFLFTPKKEAGDGESQRFGGREKKAVHSREEESQRGLDDLEDEIMRGTYPFATISRGRVLYPRLNASAPPTSSDTGHDRRGQPEKPEAEDLFAMPEPVPQQTKLTRSNEASASTRTARRRSSSASEGWNSRSSDGQSSRPPRNGGRRRDSSPEKDQEAVKTDYRDSINVMGAGELSFGRPTSQPPTLLTGPSEIPSPPLKASGIILSSASSSSSKDPARRDHLLSTVSQDASPLLLPSPSKRFQTKSGNSDSPFNFSLPQNQEVGEAPSQIRRQDKSTPRERPTSAAAPASPLTKRDDNVQRRTVNLPPPEANPLLNCSTSTLESSAGAPRFGVRPRRS